MKENATIRRRAIVLVSWATLLVSNAPAYAQTTGFGNAGNMGQPADELLDDSDLEDDDLFAEGDDERHAAVSAKVGPRVLLLEPAGLAVLPLLSYGVGFAHDLPLNSVGPSTAKWSMRARYVRGSITLGSLHAQSELTTVEWLWTFYRSLYLAPGFGYRNIRANLEDLVVGDHDVSGSVSATGLTLSFGIAQSLGTYVLGCDIAGLFQPLGGRRHRGQRLNAIDDRDPHADTLDRAAEGMSTSVLRLYFGPRF